MSMLSNLVECLRERSKLHVGATANLLNEAARTIEVLSAKLSAANLERSSQYYHDGWIPCDERLPDKTDFYLIQYSRKICADEMAVAFYSIEEARLDSKYSWEFKSIGDVKKVIAWMPLPEPYKPKEKNNACD